MVFHFVKWLTVIPFLLLVPYSAFVIIFLAIILFGLRRVNEFDLLLLLIIIALVNYSLKGMGDYSYFRFILIPFILMQFILIRDRHKILKNLFFGSIWNTLFFFYLFINVLFVSYDSLYSLSQLLIFLLLIMTSLGGSLVAINKGDHLENLEGLFLAIVVASFLVMPIHSIAYARNGVGFQGVLVHPNIFAITIAPYFCLIFHRILKSITIFDILMLIITASYLYMSQSRTAVFSVAIALFIMIVINLNFRPNIVRLVFLCSGPLAFILLFQSEISATAGSFLKKGHVVLTIKESIEVSRGRLFLGQLNNVKNNPLFGIGFKIPSNLKKRTMLKATGKGNYYEKGNMIMAVTEELGIVGLVLFAMFLFNTLFRGYRNYKKNAQYLMVAICALLTTMGEATLFSIGGAGMLIWVLVFLNYRYNYRCNPQKINHHQKSNFLLFRRISW